MDGAEVEEEETAAAKRRLSQCATGAKQCHKDRFGEILASPSLRPLELF